MALIAIGSFVFEAGQTSYETLLHKAQARWPSQERIRAPLARQFVGPGERSVAIHGALYPFSGYTSDPSMIRSFIRAGLSGETFMVVGGDGDVFGRFVFISIDEDELFLNADGSPKKYTYKINLEEYGGDAGGGGLF